ncbi:ran-binding protein 3-like [Gastrophryne carolinensis]
MRPPTHSEPLALDQSLLAQPAFVIDKKERPFKRHAGDLVLKTENGKTLKINVAMKMLKETNSAFPFVGLCVFPEKRLRSSSFTFRPSQSASETGPAVLEKRVRSSSLSLLAAFPPNRPALNKNVFTPSTLLQDQTHRSRIDSAEDRLHSWTVIRPARLQAPQITVSTDGAEHTGAEDKTLEVKSSTGEVNNARESESSHGSVCTLGMEMRMQPFDQASMLQKYSANFVFGENMEKRVMSPKRPTPSQTSITLCKQEPASVRLSCNRDWPYRKHRLYSSLLESAAAYTSRPKMKYELDRVDIVTGEESERNVLQVNCKLFVFNKQSQVWTERGQGYLRLNDMVANGSGPFRSRIVMRNHGNLKLILNSNIFDEMKLEKANRRSLRITATDLTDNRIKIFLVQASVKDAGRLHAAIHHRLIALRNRKAQQESAANSDGEPDSQSTLLHSDSDDEEDDETLLYPSKMSDHHQWIRRQPVLYS